eukprot:1366466-Pleurochrysis_carterae.AAC.1
MLEGDAGFAETQAAGSHLKTSILGGEITEIESSRLDARLHMSMFNIKQESERGGAPSVQAHLEEAKEGLVEASLLSESRRELSWWK